MSEVMVVFKVFPADADVDLAKVEALIMSAVNVKKVEREPIAFGLELLRVTVFMMDAEGVADEAEQKIREVEGVGEVEVAEMTRLM